MSAVRLHTAAEQLTLRVLGALLREDVLGLRTQSLLEQRADGAWLRAGTLALPVRPDGFQSEWTARLPLLLADGRELTALDDVLAHLAELADPQDRDGYRGFAEECRQTLATMELHEAVHGQVLDLLALRHGEHPAHWEGLGASLAFDTLAAFLDHPVYPTARGRSGLSDAELRQYAPEFHPSFELRWLAVPAGALAVDTLGERPAWWPTLERLGLGELTGTHLPLPVHPLSTADALAATPGAVLAGPSYLEVVPTLSMRTVALVEHPEWHLKLPLATATLGLRNRRTIKPGVLEDGAAGQRLIEAVLAREPRFAERILHADEQGYAHTGHELVAVLTRRYPAGLERAVTVPLASLLAEAPDGLVIDLLAERFYGGSALALYRALLELLIDWQTALYGLGFALESHQQNTSLVLDTVDGATRLRLLYKDNDGPRVNSARIGELAAHTADFTDPRTFSETDRAITDLFTTITGHLCTASLAFGLAEHGRAPLEETLGLLRETLEHGVERIGPAGEGLRAGLLQAERLPVKAMVTAGSLLSKERSGAADINKHYTSGPNYLLREGLRGAGPAGAGVPGTVAREADGGADGTRADAR
ncbi:IucA/IucC family protein [Kitasatospora albolonga]|uniref:IucA/IucC family protein n=1 Tax=Kitasatospora albolonga TaxID=68173 RepID=UPI0031EF3DF2